MSRQFPFNEAFINEPVLGWAIDDWEAFYRAMEESIGDKNLVNRYINRYASQVFNQYILPMFTNAPLPLNLGGKTEKERIVATSVPQGVFDFSLAAQGLYRVPAYYSEKLAQEFPDKFIDLGTLAGIVPPDKVRKDVMGFYYEDKDGKFPCKLIQKGQVEMDLGIKGAKLKFATRTKKVYLTFKRNRGKVRYVEFYSLFYYTSLNGNAQYAIRHLPVLMAAEYLESIGIKVRFYMTRFVRLESRSELGTAIRKKWRENSKVELPLYGEAEKTTEGIRRKNFLFVQPIIAKDFGEEINYPLFFSISSATYSGMYDSAAKYTFGQELMTNLPTGGYPDWEQSEYREGFDRYVNKYQIYNKLGIFKSKEVLPEAMIFFHDMVIKLRLPSFIKNVANSVAESRVMRDEDEQTTFVATSLVTSPFFNWWMRLSATNLKNKVILLNSTELVKDLQNISREIENLYVEFRDIIRQVPPPTTTFNGQRQYRSTDNIYASLAEYLEEFGLAILRGTDEQNGVYGYNFINSKQEVDVKLYVSSILSEITTYANGIFFGTDDEIKEKREELETNILEALSKI